jgi:hypothetical protein
MSLRRRPVGRHEVLEGLFVEMDPVLDGLCGVFVELLGVGERATCSWRRPLGTGNRLLRFSSESPDLAHALFEAELGSPG